MTATTIDNRDCWRAKTVKQQVSRPRSNLNCVYDANSVDMLSRVEFTKTKNKLVAKSIINRKVISDDQKDIEISNAYAKIDEKKIKPNKALDIILDHIKDVYLNPEKKRHIFARRKLTKWVKSGRLPRGERLKVMMDIMSYMVLSTNFGQDNRILLYYKNTEASPSVANLVEFFELQGYSEPRVRRAYADCIKCGFIIQKPRLIKRTNKKTIKIRSLPYIKNLSDVFLELIGVSSKLVGQLIETSRKKWFETYSLKGDNKITVDFLLQKMIKDADDAILKPKETGSPPDSNKAPPYNDDHKAEIADHYLKIMKDLT